ncbi:MAG: thiamine phosphate synthase [Cryomorphaceae bacterium]
MEVIVFTTQQKTKAEIQRVIQLFENGLETLLIRKPKWTTAQIEAFIESIPQEHHKRIVVHGNYGLAFKYGLKGIHLHRRDRANKFKNRLKRSFFKLRKPNLVICTTFNSLESLRENIQSFDFVFLNSVFSSHAHYSKTEEAGLNMLRSIISKSNIPVYALGGVRPEHIPVVKAAGFDGVGLSSYVWKAAEPGAGKVISIFKAA